MIVNEEQLKPYEGFDPEFIPLHPWNKKIKGVGRGKTPIHNDWTRREYKEGLVEKWIGNGYNIGYRIKADELVVDIDPRNFEGNDSDDRVADLFGYFDIDDMVDGCPSVRTGGGGYHIFFTLPDGVNCKRIREMVEGLPGIEFKRAGRQVVAAGSRHPNGTDYVWVNQCERSEVPQAALDTILRAAPPQDADYSSGLGCITGNQLEDLILDKLDITDYQGNDAWFPLLCSAHHATDGEGVDQFTEWCLADPDYSGAENQIRARWDSLFDRDGKETLYTVGTLIRELKNKGADTAGIKAVITFGAADIGDLDDDDSEEHKMIKEAKEAADKVDASDMMAAPTAKAGEAGAAIAAAKKLTKQATMEDKMMVMRLIKAASLEEAIEAQEVLTDAKVMSQGAINKRLKALEGKIMDSVTEILANTAIETVFKKGRHILTEPNKQIWAFRKTHWIEMSDEYLGKLVYAVLDTLKTKISVDGNEVAIVSMAVKAVRMRSSVLATKMFNTAKHRPVINCKNGEVWINRDGTHTVRPHSYKSYQIRCLSVDYDPSAECPLFMRTLEEIFQLYTDRDAIVRHLGELMGYIIQPYKPDAGWWMFRGPGGDGKSTIMRVLNGILGDMYYPADEGLLSTGSGGGNNHATTDLVGKLAVVIEELRAGKVLNDSGLKMLSENTKMTANPKNRDTYSFNYIGTLIMCCNNFPVIKDTSEGTVRRANVIPFNRQFVKHGADDSNRARDILTDKDELAGVLNWMLEGYQRYINRGGWDVPASCLAAKEEWLCEGNNSVRFVRENIEVDDIMVPKMGPAGIVYKRYERWCDVNGTRAKGRNRFYQDLENLGLHKRQSHGNKLHLYGGTLLAEQIEDFDEE